MVKSDGRSISFLRQKARAQKARKLGLSGLSASFQYMNFALLIGRFYVQIRVRTVGFPRGKNQGLCTLHTGVGENGYCFAEEWWSNPFMQTWTTCRNPSITSDYLHPEMQNIHNVSSACVTVCERNGIKAILAADIMLPVCRHQRNAVIWSALFQTH